MKRLNAFFAYPSQPPSVPATIQAARTQIHKQMNAINLVLWEDMKVAGRPIIQKICDEISQADLFCADLTGMNPNVMFELGYAIGSNKRIWPILDTSRTESKSKFDQLQFLTTLGYSDYRNAEDIWIRFFQESPYDSLDATVFQSSIKPLLGSEPPSLLYLKNRHATEASRQITRRLDSGVLPLTMDDPLETTPQTLSWYATKVYASYGVLCHMTSPDRDGAQLHNARLAFVAGMASAWRRPLLILSEGDYLAPMDYRDLQRRYRTPNEALNHFQAWVEPLISRWKADREARAAHASKVQMMAELRELQVGEPVAENEATQLMSYFVETAAYNEALRGGALIFVGRKGSGKTANFLKLTDELQGNADVITCVIKPVSYDIQGVVDLLRHYAEQDTKGYAIEALWKFLLYSEIAATIVAQTQAHPHMYAEEGTADLVAYVARHEADLSGDFTVRLERCLAKLANAEAHDREGRRIAISQALHQSELGTLKRLIGEAILGRHRVAILVDNLDKAWDRQEDLVYLPEVFLGLLSAANRLADDFRRRDSRRQAVEVSFAIFVRSDIFDRIIAVAREPDKIRYERLGWGDDELLLRVVDERFASTQSSHDPEKVWTRFFVQRVEGTPVKSYILSCILRRPRDLVYFVKSAVSMAINHGHDQVEATDLEQAYQQYSHFAVESFLVEQADQRTLMENVLFEFMGGEAEMDEMPLRNALVSGGVPMSQVDEVLDQMLGYSFLGMEVARNSYRYADDKSDIRRIRALARRHASTVGLARYCIHPAFRPFLEIRSPGG